MLHVGLTGGIGSGKSTVALLLAELGARTMDADEIVRGLLAPGGGAVGKVRGAFGDGVVSPEGGIDRALLADRVFSDPEARVRLEGILHPMVLAERRRRLDAERRRDPSSIVVTEASLIFEAKTEGEFDFVVLVAAPESTRRERLAGAGWALSEVERRMAVQWPDEKKAERADWVLWNGGGEEETRASVRKLWAEIKERARAAG